MTSPHTTTAQEGTAARLNPVLWQNWITTTGIFVVVLAIILLLTFGLFSLITPDPNPYVDIVGYLVIPGVLVVGVILTPLGILIRSWRLRRLDPTQRLVFRFPSIDLTDARQRRAIKFLAGLTFIMLPVVGVSGYHGYHYTDSVAFCAKACHSVMQPEAVTYARSPHARVSCAECHIGEGAGWFVKSKLSGTRQVFATLGNTYPRPIPPAITELRPARETCERCHWPEKFYGAQLAEIVNFSSDEGNTRRQIQMLVKIGGGDETSGRAEGIHMHMALAGRVEYVATDEKLQEIPWVRWTNDRGEEVVYRSDGKTAADAPPEGRHRQLDCMDCHNRPAHNFRPPERSVDVALEVGRIDTTLPFIKQQAVAALVAGYPDQPTAEARISSALERFYQTRYPQVWDRRKASVTQAIEQVQEIYRTNFFPDMKVDWRTYPDNIGHKNFAGCFRCHAGNHVSDDGRKITHRCDICHTFLNPVNDHDEPTIIQEGGFVHPVPLEGPHEPLLCHQCHTGGVAPEATCAGCHRDQQGFRAATLAEFSAFQISASPMSQSVDCQGCHDGSAPLNLESIDGHCLDCHEDDGDEYEGMLARWAADLAQGRAQAEQTVLELDHWIDDHGEEPWVPEANNRLSALRQVLRRLDQVGPLHNHSAAVSIYQSVAGQAAQQLAQLKALTAPQR